MQKELREVNVMVERIHGGRELPNPPKFVRERNKAEAERLSRLTAFAAHTEPVTEALFKLTALLYEKTSPGQWVNVDSLTGQILVPVPWGNSGWKQWGLRNWEAVIVRKIFFVRMSKSDPLPLFSYNDVTARWHLDKFNYDSKESALHYLKRHPISSAEWHQHSESYRHKRQEQRAKREGK